MQPMTFKERRQFEWWLDQMNTDPSLVEAMGRQTADDPQFGDILSNWKALHPDEAQKLEVHQRVVRELLARFRFLGGGVSAPKLPKSAPIFDQFDQRESPPTPAVRARARAPRIFC